MMVGAEQPFSSMRHEPCSVGGKVIRKDTSFLNDDPCSLFVLG